MEEGFVISNKIRRMVFREIQAGEGGIDLISKKCHLIKRSVETAVDELIKEGIIEKKEGKLSLTKKGERISFTNEKTK